MLSTAPLCCCCLYVLTEISVYKDASFESSRSSVACKQYTGSISVVRRSSFPGSTQGVRSARGNRSRMTRTRSKRGVPWSGVYDSRYGGCTLRIFRVRMCTREAANWDGGKVARSSNPVLTLLSSNERCFCCFFVLRR